MSFFSEVRKKRSSTLNIFILLILKEIKMFSWAPKSIADAFLNTITKVNNFRKKLVPSFVTRIIADYKVPHHAV